MSRSTVRTTRRRKPDEPAVREFVAEILPTTLFNRLQLLGLPNEAIDLIVNSTYKISGEGTESVYKPLFAHSKSVHDSNIWVYRYQEIQDIIRVYDVFKGQNIATGSESDPVLYQYDPSKIVQYSDIDLSKDNGSSNLEVKTDEEILPAFRAHIEFLIEDRQKKTEDDTLSVDDSIFLAPNLADLRRQEELKMDLLNRKRVVIRGEPCPRCHKDEIYQMEVQLRSGDEPATQINTCSRCNHKWNY